MLTSTKERWYFEVGDWVYLMVLPYRLKSLAKKCNEKLSPWFFGPYQVLDKFGPVAYHLAFPPSSCIHLVFHVSVLKKALPPDVQAHEIPEELTEEWEMRAERGSAGLRYNRAGAAEVLVHWKHLPSCDDSWEPLAELLRLFPNSHVEEKVRLVFFFFFFGLGGGGVIGLR